jgi:hypothetical protein
MADSTVQQWACRGNVGMMNVGLVIEVAGPRLTVRARPNVLAWIGGVAPLIAEPGSGLTVTTKQGELGLGQYIYFRLPGWRTYRLWTPSRQKAQAMLSSLANAGFDVPNVG